MFWLQHDNKLLQVLQVGLLCAFEGAENGDDALSDVGQIDSSWFLHDWFPLYKQQEVK